MDQKIGAVILAAGGSSRLGYPKQLLRYRGSTLVRRMINAVEGAGCSPIALVVGSHAEEVSQEAVGCSCRVIRNPDWQTGMGSSLRAGVRGALEAEPGMGALFILVCDQYAVDQGFLRELLQTRLKIDRAIVASEYSGTRGVPALFDRSCFAELMALPDHSGAKMIIQKDPDRVTTVCFPEGASDVDSLEDAEDLR